MIEAPRVRWRSAVVEGVTVVGAILVAFAIDAWWDTQRERESVDAYLNSLLTELQSNKAVLERHIGTLEEGIERSETYMVTIVLAPAGSVSLDSLRGMASTMGPPTVLPMQRAAFDDLVSGGLQLIREAEIRRLILEYGQAMEVDVLRQQRLEAWFDARANPYGELEGDLAGMRVVGGPSWPAEVDARFDFDAASFVGNRRYANLLTARIFRMRAVVASRTALLQKLAELEDRLRG